MSAILHGAISANTRRTYERPQGKWREWCAARGHAALPITIERAEAWLEHLAVGGTITANTIRYHRSAISTLHAESAFRADPNPLDSPAITRMMKAVKAHLRTRDAAAKKARPLTISITPALLVELEAIGRGGTPADAMMWAAACVGTCALLRPSELLGSPQNRDRHIRAVQITFFVAADSSVVAGWLPDAREATIAHFALPDRFAIALEATKADPDARNEPIVVATRIAVAALWRWMNIRRGLGAVGPKLFCVPLSPPLVLKRLIARMQDLLESIGRGRPHITGRAFRRGGASGLVGDGVSRADAAAAGRWKAESMLDVYADAESKARRAITTSRRMAP